LLNNNNMYKINDFYISFFEKLIILKIYKIIYYESVNNNLILIYFQIAKNKLITTFKNII